MKIYHLSPIIYVLSCIRIALGRTEWIENVNERTETEISVDTPRFRLLFLKTIIQFGKDLEQVQQCSLIVTSPFSLW